MLRKPLIGLTCSLVEDRCQLPTAYTDAIAAAGGLPVVIPPLTDLAEVTACRHRFDGFIIIGGNDIAASRYGLDHHPEMTTLPPRRENWEFALVSELLGHSRQPLLGICLGCQIINVAAGGSLYRHLPEDLPNAGEHRRLHPPAENIHPVRVVADSPLAAILGVTELSCNSSHHQAVNAVAPGFSALAWAEDGVIEAIGPTSPDGRFLLGLQWHPERIHQQPPHDRIFTALVENC
ncbi:MAG TPA: gamma-glutamyl-gamma-aminobutyrate hydrolase family protein [Lentisphaeria bacterium]|nr:gamma-glutamyl-gamma-aminobutyrate hydrolase family protein [Lentisphaeria bacterium]